MRYLVAIVEALLALVFFVYVASQLISGKFGLVDLAGYLLGTALALWLAKKAIANIKTKPGLGQA